MQKPPSFRVDVFVFSAITHKLESDSGFRIGLAVVEAAVLVDHGPGVVAHRAVVHFATAEVTRIAVTTNAVISVFITILLEIGAER
jgi:hypothetical protein